MTLAYYLLAWIRVGHDPEAGVIIPHYEPPKGFSPASTRYIRQMGYDHKAFTAALVNLAVKGLLQIREDDEGFSVERTGKPALELAAGEKALLKGLFPQHMAGQGERKSTGRLPPSSWIRKIMQSCKKPSSCTRRPCGAITTNGFS